jgi:hypothetical protein
VGLVWGSQVRMRLTSFGLRTCEPKPH